MLQLTPDECRVLGTLVEKAQTTPGQYPLTLNALTNGCNQKNNREPVTELDEETVFDGVDGLRRKGLVREVMLSGSRVQKFRHVAREVLNVNTAELAIVAELLLRGPQSVGELRGRASRMASEDLDSLEKTQLLLDALAARPEPLVKFHPPPPGSRAGLYVQQLCPDLHPIQASSQAAPPAPQANGLEARVAELERELSELRQEVARLATLLA